MCAVTDQPGVHLEVVASSGGEDATGKVFGLESLSQWDKDRLMEVGQTMKRQKETKKKELSDQAQARVTEDVREPKAATRR